MASYVWYAGYGSNLSRQRFLCYIVPGTPRFGRNRSKGCRDRTPPTADKPITIPYPLYFALPHGVTETRNWGPGGAAFIRTTRSDVDQTLGRAWRITEAQFEEVWNQEGRGWYDEKLVLGSDGGESIVTIRHGTDLADLIAPSAAYVKTIAEGLRETYGYSDDDIVQYLLGQDGVRGMLDEPTLRTML